MTTHNFEKLENGRWVTIKGVHVYLKDNRVAKGPAKLLGKDVSELRGKNSKYQEPAKTSFQTSAPKRRKRLSEMTGWEVEKYGTGLQKFMYSLKEAWEAGSTLLLDKKFGADSLPAPRVPGLNQFQPTGKNRPVTNGKWVTLGPDKRRVYLQERYIKGTPEYEGRMAAKALKKKQKEEAAQKKQKEQEAKEKAKREAAAKGALPEDPEKYFKLDGPHVMLPLKDLIREHDRPQGNVNAKKYMRMALEGEGDKRKPITVQVHRDGTLTVVDGNSTTQVARDSGWESIPATLLPPPEGRGEEFWSDPYLDTWDEIITVGKQVNDGSPDSWQAILNQGHGVDEEIDGKVTPYEEAVENPRQDKPLVIFGPLKSKKRSVEKVQNKYRGNMTMLGDVVRGTVVAEYSKLQDIREGITREIEQREGWDVISFDDKITKPTSNGYRDQSFSIRSPQGLVTELQLVTPKMFQIKATSGHKLYELWRKVTKDGKIDTDTLSPGVQQIVEQTQKNQETLYAKAWEEDSKR